MYRRFHILYSRSSRFSLRLVSTGSPTHRRKRLRRGENVKAVTHHRSPNKQFSLRTQQVRVNPRISTCTCMRWP